MGALKVYFSANAIVDGRSLIFWEEGSDQEIICIFDMSLDQVTVASRHYSHFDAMPGHYQPVPVETLHDLTVFHVGLKRFMKLRESLYQLLMARLHRPADKTFRDGRRAKVSTLLSFEGNGSDYYHYVWRLVPEDKSAAFHLRVDIDPLMTEVVVSSESHDRFITEFLYGGPFMVACQDYEVSAEIVDLINGLAWRTEAVRSTVKEFFDHWPVAASS